MPTGFGTILTPVLRATSKNTPIGQTTLVQSSKNAAYHHSGVIVIYNLDLHIIFQIH